MECLPHEPFRLPHDNDLICFLHRGDPLGNDDLRHIRKALLNPLRIPVSVAVSTALVESSRIKILGRFKTALAMQSRCFWPPDKFTPPDRDTYRTLYPGNAPRIPAAPAILHAHSISSLRDPLFPIADYLRSFRKTACFSEEQRLPHRAGAPADTISPVFRRAHLPLRGFIKSWNQLDQRRLRRAGTADNSHRLSRLYVETDIGQDVFLCILFIFK